MFVAQFSERAPRRLPPASAQLRPRKIPVSKSAPRLRGVGHPAAQFLARGLAFRSIKLVEFFKDHPQLGIGWMMFDEILECVVAGFWRLQLQMRFGHRAQSCDQYRAARAFWPA